MVSVKRARECIGRPVKHVTNVEVQGVVDKVVKGEVWVRTADGERIPCIPENLEWDGRIHPVLLASIQTGELWETAQLAYSPPIDEADIGILFSPAIANDDGLDHPLYVVAPAMNRVYRTWPTADPWLPHFIEEHLGWHLP